jgi:hypothetical protein
MGPKVINIEKDFSRYPAGRFKADGPHSGERFREELLIPALKSCEGKIIVEFDGARGLGSSFLEEAFGGLIRVGFSATELRNRLDMHCKDKSLTEEVLNYIQKQADISGRG